MDAEDKFVLLSTLICEPARARMLWNLLDARAYTAGELAVVSGTSSTSASNHLGKLLAAGIIKVEAQGRHRYYSITNSQVAYAIEAMGTLASSEPGDTVTKEASKSGITFCRTCYDHLAGYVSVTITEKLEEKKYLIRSLNGFAVSEEGWKWFAGFGIKKENCKTDRRPLTRQCLDWSERRPHIAGALGAALLIRMLERKWFKKSKVSRELVVTSKGRLELYDLLGIGLY